MPRFEVDFYEKENGEQPAKEFMLSLDKKLRAKLADTIMILQDNGYELREPYSKHISEGIFELRAKQGSDITRVMYFFYVDRHIILTNGFIKKTQKTPQSEIEKAKRYRSDYLKRKERTLGAHNVTIFSRSSCKTLNFARNMKRYSRNTRLFRPLSMRAKMRD